MLPIVVRQLYAMSRQLGHLHVKEGGRDEAEVTEITQKHKIIRHMVNKSCMHVQGVASLGETMPTCISTHYYMSKS